MGNKKAREVAGLGLRSGAFDFLAIGLGRRELLKRQRLDVRAEERAFRVRCHEIGVQLEELGVQWVPVDAEKFYSWLHNTPGLKWTDVVAMLVRKLRQTKQLNKQHNNGKDTHNH